MDTEFPGNSRRRIENTNGLRPAVEREATEPKTVKLEKVVTGKVVKRKKPLGRRFVETFFAGDGVLGYLGKEVLLPALQNLITDFVTQGVEKAVYGEVRTSRSSYRGGSAPRTHISYDRYASSRTTARETTPARRLVNQPSAFSLGEYIVETRAEAEMICERMEDTAEEYGCVTVANLNELLEQSSQYTDHKYGWTDLKGMSIRRLREGYLIQLPEPEDLR